jgi:molybdenum cofactor synthesis domain-containing protein
MNAESMLKEVKVEDAVGLVLGHDLTQIIPGQFKGRLFKKGHVIQQEDIPALLSIGKEHIYILNIQAGYLHEDEAAERMAKAIRGAHVALTEPSEGKVLLKSEIHGLLKVDQAFIDAANSIEQIAMATLKTDTVVEPGANLVGTRVIPLIVEEAKIAQIEEMALEWREKDASGVIRVKPFRPLKVGIITTGSEVFKGRIEDKFGPVVQAKVEAFGSQVVDQRYTPDDSETIVQEIRYFLEQNVDMILVTGGMSVDPDDRTPGAIKLAGADIISHGTPMLPGSMLMMAYLGGIPILGLPGSVMHDKFTVFDVLLPRICAGERITRQDIVALGYGGLYSDRG